MTRFWIQLFCLAAAGACSPGDADSIQGGQVLSFDKRRIHVVTGADSVPVNVEVAASAEQRTLGLMERTRLAPDSGMLFVYDADQPANAGFWMFRTRIPLDIAFADSTGVIGAVRTMAPCTATLAAGCPNYEPGVAYRYALEVNGGFFAQHRIAPGSRLTGLPGPR